jgi:hypothetical protein
MFRQLISSLLVSQVCFSLASASNQNSFSNVRSVIESKQTVYPTEADGQLKSTIDAENAVYQRGEIPAYSISVLKMISIVGGGIKNKLLERARKTISERDDYYDRLEKLVHPNGICFTGEWEITEDTKYTGYFSKGKKGLFIGRASAVGTETRADQVRGFGFAGKIFPTLNPDENVSTANFFTVDVIPGKKRQYYSETELTNEPETDLTAVPLMAGYQLGLISPAAFAKASLKLAELVDMLATITFSLKFAKSDGKENPGFRPLYPVAQAGTSPASDFKSPNWIKVNFTKDSVKMTEADFRKELNLEPGKSKTMDISVGDNKSSGQVQWRKIGKITLNESFISYGCDRRLHFAHPPELR